MCHLHPDHVSSPSKSRYPRLSSIQVASQLHPGQANCSSAPTMPHLTQIQVSIYASHIGQCPVSPPSRSVNSRLKPIQAKSHIHPSPKICIARPSRSRLTSIKDRSHYSRLASIQDASQLHPSHRILDLSSIQVPSHPNQGLKICVSHPSLPHLTFIKIPKFVCYLHPGCILPSSMLLNLGPDIYVSPPPWSRPISIQLPRIAFPLLAGSISPSSMSRDACLTFIQVPSQLHPGPNMWVSIPSRSRITSIQVGRIASQLRARPISPPLSSRNIRPDNCSSSHPHPHLGVCISPSPWYHITAITVPRFLLHLQPLQPMNWICNVAECAA